MIHRGCEELLSAHSNQHPSQILSLSALAASAFLYCAPSPAFAKPQFSSYQRFPISPSTPYLAISPTYLKSRACTVQTNTCTFASGADCVREGAYCAPPPRSCLGAGQQHSNVPQPSTRNEIVLPMEFLAKSLACLLYVPALYNKWRSYVDVDLTVSRLLFRPEALDRVCEEGCVLGPGNHC
jgi:hypothetical protein